MDLHSSDPISLAVDMLKLSDLINVKIYGGCCGMDNTHARNYKNNKIFI